jgi:hypothetical protein
MIQPEEGSVEQKGDEVPWPSFDKFSPINIKRTASAFMKEFEKSLASPPLSPDHRHESSSALTMRKSAMDHEARLLLNNLP